MKYAALAAILAAAVATASGQRAGTIAVFTGARLIDGTGRPAIPNATIVVRDGRIVAAGAVKPPDGAPAISLAGKTVIPGLINAHGHAPARADHSRHTGPHAHRSDAHAGRTTGRSS